MKKFKKELIAVLIIESILISMSIYKQDIKMLIISGAVVTVMTIIIMVNSKD